MTARNSTGNFSKFGTYFLYKLRTLRPLIILMGIFSLLSYPLLTGFLVPYMHATVKTAEYREQLGYDINRWSDQTYVQLSDMEDLLGGLAIMAVVICVIMLIAIFIMSFVVTHKNFRWLYNKTIVDMDYSLPISDDTRFFGDLLSTLAACLVPHLLAIAVGKIIFACRPRALEEELQEVLKSGIIDQALCTGVFACIMLMAYVLFILSICGRKAETRLYPIAITIAVPIIHAVCLWLSYGDVYGYEFGSSISDFNSLSFTSPYGFLFMSFIYCVEFMGDIEQFALPLFRAAYAIPAILITIGLFVGAYFLIRHRRAERVGQPFVYRCVKFIIPAIIIFTIVSPIIGVMNEYRKEYEEYGGTPHYEGFIIAMLIVTFVVYVIMELISGKGFKKFHLTLVKYIATMGVSVLVCVLLLNAHGFGIANYVPDADDVQSVSFRLHNYNLDGARVNADIYEKDNIAAIVAAHEAQPKEKTTETTDRVIYISYSMKNGETVERRYYLSRSEYNSWLDAVLTSEAYYYDNIGCHTDYFDGTEVITEVEVGNWGLSYEVNIPLNELTDAFRADCDNATTDQMFGNDTGLGSDIYINIKNKYGYRDGWTITIYDWMTETIGLFAEHNVGIYIPEQSRVDISGYPTAFLVKAKSNNYYFDPATAFIMTGDNTISENDKEEYGINNYMYTDDYLAQYGSTSYYDPEYSFYDDTIDCEIINYCPARIEDKNTVAEVMTWCSEGVSMTYSQDDVYMLVVCQAENAREYLEGGKYDWMCFYVTENHYNDAEALFDSLAA